MASTVPASESGLGTEVVTKVTAWFAWDHRREGFSFNHIEDGWSEDLTPADNAGRRWHRNRWERRHALLVPGGRWGAPVLQVQGPAVESLLTTQPD